VRRRDGTLGVEFLGSTHDTALFRVDGESYTLAFADFPWFEGASDEDLGAVERPSPSHLSWPALDVDLSVESMRHPERYPLISRVR